MPSEATPKQSLGVHLQKTFATFLWVNIRQSALSLVQLMVVEMHPRILDSVGMICVVVVVVVVVEFKVVVGVSGASLTTLLLRS